MTPARWPAWPWAIRSDAAETTRLPLHCFPVALLGPIAATVIRRRPWSRSRVPEPTSRVPSLTEDPLALVSALNLRRRQAAPCRRRPQLASQAHLMIITRSGRVSGSDASLFSTHPTDRGPHSPAGGDGARTDNCGYRDAIGDSQAPLSRRSVQFVAGMPACGERAVPRPNATAELSLCGHHRHAMPAAVAQAEKTPSRAPRVRGPRRSNTLYACSTVEPWLMTAMSLAERRHVRLVANSSHHATL